MTEQAQFRIGGVYRDEFGNKYLLRQAGGEQLAMASVWIASEHEFEPHGLFHRLDNGRFDSLADYAESKWHLIPGELTLRNGEWAPMDAPATIGPFGSGASLKTDGSQITGREEAQSKTYHYKGAGSVFVTVGGGCFSATLCGAGGGGGVSMTPTLDKLEQEAVANAPMIERDFRAPTDRERRAMTAVRESAWATAIIEHAKSADQPKPYPFAAFTSPDQRMTADSPTHGSAHLLKD